MLAESNAVCEAKTEHFQRFHFYSSSTVQMKGIWLINTDLLKMHV